MVNSSLRSTSAHVLVDVDALADGVSILLDAATEHHLRRVLRLRDGEAVSVTDGEGRWCLTTAIVERTSLRLDPTSPVVAEASRTDPITVASAMPRGERLDWLVQKVTELGVDHLILLHTERSVTRWKPDRIEHQRARLQRIADEALRQSRRVWRLRIEAPVEAADVLAGFVVAEPGGRRLERSDTMVAIGPEGGWSDAELDLVADRVDLGPTILRTETAAVALSALCVTFER